MPETDPVPQAPPSSNLGNVMVQGSSGPTQVNTNAPDFNQDKSVPSESQAPQPTSRLKSVLAAVANVAETGLSGIPDKGRPSFVTGLGSGARAEQAAQANQQAVKFRDLDSQLRIAQMHNDDLRLQNQTQAQQNANDKEWRDRHDWLEDKGYDDTTIPNHADAVTNHMQAMTAANGSVSVTPGSSVNPDGNTIHIPTDTQETRDAQKKLYDTFSPAYGLGSRPENQDFVPGKQIDILQHLMQGKNPDGSPINHDKLPGMIASYQTQRDTLAQKGSTSPDVSKQLDNTIGILKAQQDYLDKHAASVKAQDKQSQLDVENNPENQAAAARGAALKTGAEAAAKNKADQATMGNQNLTGSAFLATLPTQRASTVQAIGEGRMELTPSMLRSKDGQALAQQVATAYPDFDQSKAQSYFKTRQDFTSGKTSTAINSYNTAIAHLGTMYDHVSGTNSLQLNNPAADVHRQLDLDKQLVSTELAKAVSNGQMTEGEKNQILSSVSGYTVGSYQSRIKEAVQLLNGKLESYQQQWNNGAPPGAVSKVRILSPQSEATIARINGQAAPNQQGQTAPNQQGQGSQGSQFSHVSASGKFGWNGTQWVPTGR